MPANLEDSAVATGLEKVSFHSNPKERQCQRMLKLLHNCRRKRKEKELSEEALQIAENRREVKGNGEEERYNHLNAQLQRIAGRDNNRIRKTRNFFKKISDTKRTFHAKTGTIKDRNGMDLTEVKDTNKRWQEYTEKLYKKIFMTQITTMV